MQEFISEVFENHQSLELRIGEEVEINGMVQNCRITKWGGFIILRKTKGLLQCVFNSTSQIFDENGQQIKINELSRESAVRLTGLVNTATIKDNSVYYKTIEIAVKEIYVLSSPNTKNVVDVNALNFDSETNFVYKLDNRQVTLRNSRDVAIFKVSSEIVKGFIDYFHLTEFTQIFTPKIVSAGAEGGANIFQLDYFGKKAFLAQSPQFYKQICVGVFERVFEIAPVFRAEKHSTSRHLNEYISIDLEMGFIKDHTDIMRYEVELLRYVLQHVEKTCKHELSILNVQLPKLPHQIPTYRLSDVHDILFENYSNKLSIDHRGEPDMAPEEEVILCEHVLEKYQSDFVFVTHFPRKHRAFYSYDDPENPDLTLSFDLLMRGKEITSGSQRMHNEEDYKKKMIDLGMDPENFKFYLETFKNGMPPHGGLAIGLERLVAGVLNVHNVKEASLFPRDVNRLAP